MTFSSHHVPLLTGFPFSVLASCQEHLKTHTIEEGPENNLVFSLVQCRNGDHQIVQGGQGVNGQ